MSFDVQAGSFLGSMGPNGAGKSTLLNIISGACKPDFGAVLFRGHDITGLSPHKISRLGIGRTFQIPQPFVNLTVLQNLTVVGEYARNLGGLPPNGKPLEYSILRASRKKRICLPGIWQR